MILPMILGSKKFYFSTFLIIFVASTISPQIWKDIKIDIKYNDINNHSFIFHPNNRITGYKNGNLSDGTYTGSFIVRDEYGVTFLLITWNDKTTDKYLAIHGGTLIYLYNTESAPFFEGTYEDYIPKRPYVYTDILSASSTLREGNIIYSTDNLDKRIGICWAEGVSGHGIGEKIIFNLKKNHDNDFNVLFISTGFVSYNKPYLFKYNSRPKKIRISYEGEIAKTIELLDTPNFQEILTLWPYPQYESSYPDKNLWEKDLWIEIIDVYPGTRYDDTCINFFVWYYVQ